MGHPATSPTTASQNHQHASVSFHKLLQRNYIKREAMREGWGIGKALVLCSWWCVINKYFHGLDSAESYEDMKLSFEKMLLLVILYNILG